MPSNLATVDQVKSTLINLAITFGPKLLVALLVLVVGVLVSRWAGHWLARGLQRIEMEPPVRQLLIRILRIILILIFMVMALQNIGVELLPLIAGVGLAGAGVALAMQGVLSNIMAGLTIIFTRPFRVGEYVSIVNEEGLVDNISLFSTTLHHLDHSRVVIPNRKIVGEILHNYGVIRQLNIIIHVAYSTNMTLATRAIENVLAENSRLLKDPPALVQTVALSEFAVKIGVFPWVPALDYNIATDEVNRALLEKFRHEGIAIPLPQSEVRLLTQGVEG